MNSEHVSQETSSFPRILTEWEMTASLEPLKPKSLEMFFRKTIKPWTAGTAEISNYTFSTQLQGWKM